MNELTEFTGTVKTIIYQKDGYMIAVLNTDTKEIKFTGHFHGIEKNDNLKIKGKMVHHPKHGEQLEVQEWERPIPKTKDQIIAFLSSGLIKGVGKARAKDITAKLGDNAIEIIKRDGEKSLAGIKGIGKKTAKDIVESIKDTFEVQEIVRKLSLYGISTNMTLKLYKNYGEETVQKIQQNPYVLTEIDGVGYPTADNIAQRIGILPTSGFRIAACVEYVLNTYCNSRGHCYILENELVKQTLFTLNANQNMEQQVTRDELKISLYDLEDKKLVIEDNKVYPIYFYKYENELAQKLSKMRGSRDGEALPSLDKHIKSYQMKHGIILADKQRDAIKRLMSEQLLVLTGGPGTGKTTVVKAIIEIYKKINKNAVVRLAAPTGRASRKLNESTGQGATTIHKMIGYGVDKYPQFNADNKLDGDLIIVDEFSMADLQLAYWLMDALENDAKVLFIGDTDQLPSVGAGNVLDDMIKSGIPTVQLTEVFRQAEESQIIKNAHRINNGESLLIDKEKDDFYFIERQNIDQIAQLIIMSAMRFEALGYTLDDMLILSPMRKTAAGTINLNLKLREALNPKTSFKAEIKVGNRFFRVGDKVMQNKNNADKNVNNGELGIVKEITKDFNDDNKLVDIMVCNFDGKDVKYYREDCNELELGYAITIHKSQGGEAPIVIMPVTEQHKIMLARNLYYTAVTRAKEKVVIIGTENAINLAIRNNRISKRNSQLDKRIIKYTKYLNRYNNDLIKHSQ